ncbi:MAG TPA: hypothetical protein VK911_02745, partial [Vicinamibacterales bacterium]|nr:hypothetical protein [Vicinamibacterales bacterium]
ALVGLAVVIPALQQALAAALTGAAPGLVLASLLESLFIHAVVVLVAAAATAVSGDAGRMALGLLAALLLVFIAGRGVRALLLPAVVRTFTLDGILAAGLVTAAGGLAVLSHQVLTRRTRRSLWLAGATAALAGVAGATAPWAIAPRPIRVLAQAPAERSALVVTLAPGGLEAAGPANGKVVLYATLATEGVPPDAVAEPVHIRSTWRFRGGAAIESTWRDAARGLYTMGDRVDRRLEEAIAAAAGCRLLNPRARPAAYPEVPLARLPEEEMERHAGVEATFESAIDFLMLHVRPAAVLAPEPGAYTTVGTRRLAVVAATGGLGNLAVVLRNTGPALLFGPVVEPALRFALVNRQRGECLLALDNQMASALTRSFPEDVLSHVRTRRAFLDFHADEVQEGLIDDDWLAGAALSVLAVEPGELLRRTVRVDGVRWADLPRR